MSVGSFVGRVFARSKKKRDDEVEMKPLETMPLKEYPPAQYYNRRTGAFQDEDPDKTVESGAKSLEQLRAEEEIGASKRARVRTKRRAKVQRKRDKAPATLKSAGGWL